MSGAIIPDPLQKPLRRTVVPSIVALAVAPLGNVSVVMIARAAGSHAAASSSAATFGRAALIRSAGGGSPMTPVEAINTSRGTQSNSRAAVAAELSTTWRPARPVQTLALPDLTT